MTDFSKNGAEGLKIFVNLIKHFIGLRAVIVLLVMCDYRKR